MSESRHGHALRPHDGWRARLATESAAAGARLGRDHPLARALEASQTAMEQVVVLVVVDAFAAGLLSRGASFGGPLLFIAVVVQLVILARLALMRASVQEECRELIIERGPHLDLPSVDRERRRLANPSTRDELARAAERMADRLAATTAIAPELREIATLLRADTADVVGVALAERLINSAGSPLYGDDEHRLPGELIKIRHRLRAAGVRSPSDA
jgi:hypothetical protein